jgi:RNA polymerase sigma-70 factor, ECF subfamily
MQPAKHLCELNSERWNDQELVRGVASRDQEALRASMERYGPRLYVVTKRVLGDLGTREDIEEIVSDSFLRAWEQIADYDPDRGALGPWLSWLAVYESLRRRRDMIRFQRLITALRMSAEDEGRRPAEMESQDIAAVVEAADRSRVVAEVRLAIKELERTAPRDAEILTRRYLREETPTEIAHDLNISPNVSRVRLSRALQKLRQLLMERPSSAWLGG